jgi:uncharacterized protein
LKRRKATLDSSISARRPRLAEPLHRLAGRWRNGGVEEYPLGVEEGPRHRRWRGNGLGIEITEHEIGLHLLPHPFRGFRIIQLSDIHHGLYFPAQALADTVEIVNRREPDLIALTGDFVTYSRAYIQSAAEILGNLKAREGVFAVLGNHDFRVGAEEIARALRRSGIEVLRNRHTILRRRGQSFYLAGVDDWNYTADLSRALRGVPHPAPSLLLSHHPAIVDSAARAGVSLVLAGHTHGGQVHLPVVGTIYGRTPEKMRFKVGWARLGPTQIYVTRGIGTIVLPVRYRCSPEIPEFTLEVGRDHWRAGSPQ